MIEKRKTDSKPEADIEAMFKEEIGVLQQAEVIAANPPSDKTAVARAFQNLTEEYKNLLQQAMKMTRIGDMAQEKLRRTQEDLSGANEKLERQAKTDGLTGLLNRRYLDTALTKAFDTAREHSRPLTVAMSDVDFFKKVNDNFSHQTGDEVLRAVAKILRDTVRDSDTVARYGGEEFVMLFPDLPVEGGLAIAERVRAAVQAYDWSTIHPDLKITISIGVSADLSLANAEKLLAKADEKLYEAKHGGRNQVRY